MSEHNANEPAGGGNPSGISRRKLLASLGAAGLALAAGGLQPETAKAAANSLIVNAKDYRARGNARYDEDDAPPIQAAIDAAAISGGIVYVPAGRYFLRSSLQLKSGVTLLGGGMHNTVLMAGSANLSFIVSYGAEQCAIEGFAFQGRGSLKMTGDPLVESGVVLNGGKDIRIVRCGFMTIVNGIRIIDTRNVKVEGCRFDIIVGYAGLENEGFGIWCSGGGDHELSGNFFQSLYQPCIALVKGASRSMIANNRMEGCYNAGIALSSGASDDPCEGNAITGNYASGFKNPSDESGHTCGVRLSGNCSSNTIKDNHIDDIEDYAVRLEGKAGAEKERPRCNVVEGNKISRIRDSGIVLVNAYENGIRCNDIRDVKADGIRIDTDGEDKGSRSSKNIIAGNSVSACGKSAVHLATGRCEGNIVYGNVGYGNGKQTTDLGTDTAVTPF